MDLIKSFSHPTAGALLVDPRPLLMAQTIFVTISPNPNTKHDVIKKCKMPNGKYKDITVKMKYGTLPQKVQYDYCMKILRTCYISFLPDCKIVGTWELNQQKNVHFHFVLDHPRFRNPKYIDIFRRDIFNCQEIMKNTGMNRDYMNNIVMLNKTFPEICKYMDKDYVPDDIFDNYQYNI